MNKKWVVVVAVVVAMAFVFVGCGAKKEVRKSDPCPPFVYHAPVKAPPVIVPVVVPKKEAAAPPVVAPVPLVKPDLKKEEAVITAPGFDYLAVRLQFALDKALLTKESTDKLVKLADWMKKNPNIKVQIQGNTCDIGTNEYNLALGDRRANAAKSYLVGLGIPANRMTTISYGEEKPAFPNDNEQNRSKNRRDDFVEMK